MKKVVHKCNAVQLRSCRCEILYMDVLIQRWQGGHRAAIRTPI